MRNSSISLGLEMQSPQVCFLLKLLLIRMQINETKNNFLTDSNKNVSLFLFVHDTGLSFLLLNHPFFKDIVPK